MTGSGTAPGRRPDGIILIGMAGAGKSTVGRCLATILDRPFIDTDSLIEQEAGTSLQDIIARGGTGWFRLLEEKVLLRQEPAGKVIATGGSAVYSSRGMNHLRQGGIIVFLDVEPSMLLRRIHNLDSRGMVRQPEQSFYDLHRERLPLYRRYADHILACGDMRVQEVCHLLVRLLQEGS
jgi:shikimate kinase